MLSVMLFSCGKTENEPKWPDSEDYSSKPKEGSGKLFLANGILVEANTKFTSDELKRALAQYDWVMQYYICYDKKKVSGVIEPKFCLPKCLLNNGTWFSATYNDDLKSVEPNDYNTYVLVNNEFYLKHNKLSSLSYYPSGTFKIMAVDLNSSRKRLIVDLHENISWCFYGATDKVPVGFDIENMWLRMVYFPATPTEVNQQ